MKLKDKAINFVMRTFGVLAQEAGHHSEENYTRYAGVSPGGGIGRCCHAGK